MRILRSLAVACSIYSKIPVPQFAWKEEDMRYMLCFFPWIGGVIGGCVYLWSYICGALSVGRLCYTAVGVAIPLLITGGFHVDGFMDTMDAFHSYRSREEKLEIMKDSHIGAFAVIMLGVWGLLFLGAFSEISDMRLLRIVCGGFFLSRCLSGIGVVSFPAARPDGMLRMFADRAQKNTVRAWLCLEGAACAGYMLLQSLWAGTVILLAALAAFACYYRRTKKELGGITGDTAGYFVVVCEGCMLLAAAALQVLTAAWELPW